MRRLAPLILVFCLSGCTMLRPILTDCAAPAVSALVASNLDRGVRALRGDSGAWEGAVSDLVAELGGAGVCLLQKLARTETGSRPQSGELAAPVYLRRDLVGQRARQWLQTNRYEVPR